MRSSPAIGDGGIIYIGSGDGNLYAINSNGTKKWAFLTGGLVTSSPAIGSDGTIYVGSRDGWFYAVNPDGSKKWEFLAGPTICSPVIAPDGVIYIQADKLYAINPIGIKKWDFPASAYLSSPAIGYDEAMYSVLLISDHTVFPPSIPTYYLYAFSKGGTINWSFRIGGHPLEESSPVVSPSGTIYVGSTDGHLYAINSNGTKKWAFLTHGEVTSSPAIGSDGTIYVGSADGRLYAINADGTQKWFFQTGNRISSSPTLAPNKTIYVGSDDGRLYAINAETGDLAISPWPKFHADLSNTGRSQRFEQPVDLSEIIITLQMLTGYDFPDGITVVDINEDGKIGIEEVLFGLQSAAGLR